MVALGCAGERSSSGGFSITSGTGLWERVPDAARSAAQRTETLVVGESGSEDRWSFALRGVGGEPGVLEVWRASPPRTTETGVSLCARSRVGRFGDPDREADLLRRLFFDLGG